MTALVVCVSAPARWRLYRTVLGLSVCSGAVSCLFLTALAYSYLRHSFMLHDLIISLFDHVYLNLALLGAKMALIAAVCWKINGNIYNQPANHSVGRCQLVWTGSASLCCATAAICASLLSVVKQAVDSQLLTRYKHGVALYLESPLWQTAIDRIQKYLECCGANGPSDWYTASWIPFDSVANSSQDVSQYSDLVQPDGRVLVPLTPPSCCRPGAPDCGYLSWLQHPHPDVAEVDPRHLFTQGCAQAIASVITMDFLYFKILLLIDVILQVGMLVSLRYLYTSSLNSLLLGRPQGSAPGWLVGPVFNIPPDFGYLARYDQVCQREDILLEDDLSKRKKLLKCFNKCKRKKKDKLDSDEQSTKTFGCMQKLKAKCKKKNKEKSRADFEDGGDNIEMKEMGAQEQFRVEQENRPTQVNNKRQVKKILSSNLMDVEEVPTPYERADVQAAVYTESTRTNNPFMEITREPIKTPRRQSTPREPAGYQGSPPTETAPAHHTDNVEQRRRIFEALNTSLNTKQPNYQRRNLSTNMVEELKIRLERPSSPASPRSDQGAPPLVLRNYRLPT